MTAERAVADPGSAGCRPDAEFPEGEWVTLAQDVRRLSPTVLFGGNPPRLMRLSPRGAEVLSELETAPVRAGAPARLARRLTDAGMANPRAARGARADVTVVVPVRDRPSELSGCLARLGRRHRVVVVDDGSVDPDAVAAVCDANGAELVRRATSGGPAAARNTGLQEVESELVAFVDSDCEPSPGWIEALAGYFVDPLVAGVAPRIVAASPGRGLSLVDLGARPAPVHPQSSVPYVPTAAVVFRRLALGSGFDEELRYGEDVDLVWRLVLAGWRIRYAPEVQVAHRDPVSVAQRLHRRYDYGTSVGPLERRHPGTIVHLVVGAGPACTVGALILGYPGPAVLAGAVTALDAVHRLGALGVGRGFALRLSVTRTVHAWLGLGEWCIKFGWPLAAASLLARRRRSGRSRHRRLPRMCAALVASALVANRLGPDGRARRVVADGCLGEVAYGLGVMVGCARAGVVAPVVPRVGDRRGSRSG